MKILIPALMILVLATLLACSGGLTEEEVRDIVAEYSVPGPAGPQGEAGSPGPQGPAGEQGAKGDKGGIGERGPQGEQGAKGDKGDTGERGPQGEQGPAGAVGKAGPIGPQGERGPAGADGTDGKQGPPGPKGDPGPAGPAGAGATAPVISVPVNLPDAGTIIEAGGSSYAVNAVQDPAPAGVFGVDAGYRLVAIDVTQIGVDDDDPYNPLYFSVQDSDGYVYGASLTGTDIKPGFSSGELSSGQVVRGWVTFEVPESAMLISVMVEPDVFGAKVVIADLT